MPVKRSIVTNDIFTEYVYDCIINATIEDRKFLTGQQVSISRNKKKARIWSIRSTMEEKILLLARLNVPCAIIIGCNKEKIAKLEVAVRKLTQSMMADMMAKENIFCISDKTFLTYANVMSANAHSETALLNKDFMRASQRLNEWKQANRNGSVKDVKNSVQSTRDISKMLYSSIIVSKYALGAFDVSETDLSVLLFLHSKRREFITLTELKIELNGIYRNFKIGVCLKHLLLVKYIEKGFGEFEGSYRLTSWGSEVINKFQKKVLSQ